MLNVESKQQEIQCGGVGFGTSMELSGMWVCGEYTLV